MKLSFHGADRGVTGSCHMIESGGQCLVVDCGMLQGGRDLDVENAADFGFDPAGVDIVLLTHAHLDHCGRLPLLVKRGFRGEVVTTAATRDLARLVLLDAAHLQEEDNRRRQRQARRRGRETEAPPLYSLLDALDSLDRFRRVAAYGEQLELAPGLRASFLRCRPHSRLRQHRGRSDGERAAPAGAVLGRHRQCRAAAAAAADAPGGQRLRRHGVDLRRPVASPVMPSRSKNSTRRSRRPSPAAAT